MTSRDFCFWLQGHFELQPHRVEISADQAELIRKHLALVFAHEIDPSAGPPEHQKILDALHASPGGPPCMSCGKQGGHQPWCKASGTGGGGIGGPLIRC